MDIPDPEYVTVDFEKTHCPECARELDNKQRCNYCEERTREEANIEYLRNIRQYYNDMGV